MHFWLSQHNNSRTRYQEGINKVAANRKLLLNFQDLGMAMKICQLSPLNFYRLIESQIFFIGRQIIFNFWV